MSLEASIKSLIMDSLLAKSSRVITSELIQEITSELLSRICELLENEQIF
jgi:hypothetical protein